jgi:hypothetical protein
MIFRTGPVSLPGRSNPTGRSVRKIALLGSHTASLKWCPWNDPSWEFWGHASSRSWYKHELDRYFDLHPKACWSKNGKEQTKYQDWLKSNTVPIYMQDRQPEVPASVRYPKERILLEYGGIRRYFKNQVAWMIALAFSEGVTHLGLFGINYGHETEYEIQRGSAEYWLGRAEERGVQVLLPDECTLLAEPAGLYGWNSHDENGKRLDRWAERKPKLAETIKPVMPGQSHTPAKPPEWLKDDIEAEELGRPDWARWEPIGKTNGGLKENSDGS